MYVSLSLEMSGFELCYRGSVAQHVLLNQR